jgi:hypothetical protein
MDDDSFSHTMPSDDEEDNDDVDDGHNHFAQGVGGSQIQREKNGYLMNQCWVEIPVGELDPVTMPLSAVRTRGLHPKSLLRIHGRNVA